MECESAAHEKLHVVALPFGAGQQDQTTPESDGGNLFHHTISYQKSGGTLLR